MPPPTLGDWDLPPAEDVPETPKTVREKVPNGDPFETAALREDVSAALEQVLTYIRYTTKDQRRALGEALRRLDPETKPTDAAPEVEYGASFDLVQEVERQIAAVRAVRDTVIGEDGKILPGTSSREAKEVIASGSTMLNTLMKFHSQVVNMDRIRRLEASVVEVLKEADPELAREVVDKLEQRLSNQ